MSNIGHSAARLAASKAFDVVLKNVDKNREKEVCKLIDLMEKYMSDEKLDVNYDRAREMVNNKDGALNK